MLPRLNAPFLMLLLAFVSITHLHAQFYNGSQITFGKNRVQYGDFLWTYFRFNNIDVYYYLNGKELALHTAEYARQYLAEIEKKLETTLDQKVQFIVYNTYNDLRQSNIGLMNQTQYNTGGITHIIGQKIFIYFDGDMNNFDRQIRAGLTRILLDGIIYGESITSQVKNSTLINMPAWFSDGLISYYSRNWDTELDNILKDGILNNKFKKFNHLQGTEAVYAGHSIWRFIAEKYGPENIANILYMTRVNRSVESGFLYVLGISFKTIIKEWESWYRKMYEEQENQSFTAYGQKVKVRIKKDVVYDRVRVSPDGGYLAYTTNDHGLYKVFLYNLGTGKQKRIFRKGIRLAKAGNPEEAIWVWRIVLYHPEPGEAEEIYRHNRASAYYNIGIIKQTQALWWDAAEAFSRANRLHQRLKYAQAWGNAMQHWLETQKQPEAEKAKIAVVKPAEKALLSIEPPPKPALMDIEANTQLLLKPRILWPLEPHLKTAQPDE